MRLIGQPHKLLTTLTFLPDQYVAFWGDNFLDWPQIGEKRLVSGHG